MAVRIEVLNLKEVQSFLQGMGGLAKEKVRQRLEQATLMVAGEVKDSVRGMKGEPKSVQTGRFLNSIQGKSNEQEGIIFSNLKYAQVLEYGLANVPGAEQFLPKTGDFVPGTGTSLLVERRHFRNSLDRKKNDVIRLIKEGVGELSRADAVLEAKKGLRVARKLGLI